MNLLSLILIAMALVVAACVFYVAWQFSSGDFETRRERQAVEQLARRGSGQEEPSTDKEEPGKSKESKDSPGS